jgi:hypothetical protein
MVQYVVVNKEERDNFEKSCHLPYGYGCCSIFTDEQKAIKSVENCFDRLRINMVVEKWVGCDMEVVYEGSWFDTSLDYNEDGLEKYSYEVDGD